MLWCDCFFVETLAVFALKPAAHVADKNKKTYRITAELIY
jgi:hypothetical protein